MPRGVGSLAMQTALVVHHDGIGLVPVVPAQQAKLPLAPRPSLKTTVKLPLQPLHGALFDKSAIAVVVVAGEPYWNVLLLVNTQEVPGCPPRYQAALKSDSARGWPVLVYWMLSRAASAWFLGRPWPWHDCGSIFCSHFAPFRPFTPATAVRSELRMP